MVDFQSRDTQRDGRKRDRGPGDDETRGGETGSGERDDGNAGGSGPSADEHGSRNGSRGPEASVNVAVVTVSEDRSHENDPAGEAVAEGVEAAGHAVATREILRPTHDSVQGTVDALVEREDVTVVVTTGGAGVGARDVTVDAVEPLLDRDLPGFGELFRRRYAEEVGTDVVGTRATAGIAEVTPVFCLPGDPLAAGLGTREIVVDQAARLVDLAGGGRAADP